MDDARILDRYRLIERLASGGTAELWRAHDEQLDRPVAVKRLHAHLLPDEASRQRLATEARAAAGLSHPAIVAVYDVDAEGETPALVMELVEGESLAARIARDGPLTPLEAARLVADLADGLFHAHQQGVIHRDVKPANVVLARDGRVRLVDFGIAHSLTDAAQRLTQTGTVIGTLPAMAPEQLAAGPITPRTDLYGLGVVLYEAITGALPYPTSTPLVLAEAQRRGPRPIEGIDPRLAAIVDSCLTYDPADRPLHAGALADALRGWASSDAPTVPAPVAPVTSSSAGDIPSAPIAPPPGTGSRAVDTTSHHGWRMGWAPIGLAAAAAAVLLVTWLGLGAPWLPDDAVADGTPTPAPSPSPTVEATPLPGWAIELAAEIEEACGDDATASPDELGAMGEEEAEDYADALIEACEEATEGDRGRGGGNGNRGNNGNGNGGNNGNGNGG